MLTHYNNVTSTVIVTHKDGIIRAYPLLHKLYTTAGHIPSGTVTPNI